MSSRNYPIEVPQLLLEQIGDASYLLDFQRIKINLEHREIHANNKQMRIRKEKFLSSRDLLDLILNADLLGKLANLKSVTVELEKLCVLAITVGHPSLVQGESFEARVSFLVESQNLFLTFGAPQFQGFAAASHKEHLIAAHLHRSLEGEWRHVPQLSLALLLSAILAELFT